MPSGSYKRTKEHNKKIGEARRRPLTHRFWEKVDKQGKNDCWEWTAFKQPQGYGLISVNRIMKLAHRVSWELNKGKIPDGLIVCHICDNPPCVNPNHLFIGTQSDNVRDMFNKGRENRKNVKIKLKKYDIRKSNTNSYTSTNSPIGLQDLHSWCFNGRTRTVLRR